MHNDRYLAAVLAIAAAVFPALGVEPRETSFDRTLTVTGPVELDAATHAGSLRVRAGADGAVVIHGVIRAARDGADVSGPMRRIQQNPPVRQEGNIIRIQPVPEPERQDVSVSYEITVPAETKVRARSGSGAIALKDIHGAVDAQTGSGPISGDALGGPIVARTGSGGIKVEQTAAAAIKAQTGSGPVVLRLPRQGGFDLRAHTGSGRISCERPLTMRNASDSQHLEGRSGSGGPLVDVRTGSGGIRIE